MIEVYFHKQVPGESLNGFLGREEEFYYRKNRAFIRVKYHDLRLIETRYKSDLSRLFETTENAPSSFWFIASNHIPFGEIIDKKVSEELLEQINTKPKRFWYTPFVPRDMPILRRKPYSVELSGGFESSTDLPEDLRPTLKALSDNGYETEVETEMDRIKSKLNNIESMVSRSKNKWWDPP